MVSNWETLATAKRQAILDAIPKKWHLSEIPSAEEQKDVTGEYIHQFLDQKEIEITETDVVGIAEKVAAGEWTAVAVTEAFCHRAALAHQLVSCLHEVFFEDAIADAKALDDYYAEHKQVKGMLHGVPVSLKDQFHVKNVETTMGYVGWMDTFEGIKGDPRAKTFESEMVKALRESGAVLYCKTSVPYTLMCGETLNNIIGYTWNPKNRYLSAGGSSGGEGALIGLRGSPVGFGTDIGGSIRIPAAFNGLYGLRPSTGRLPYEGMANSMAGQNSVLSVVGPLATTARSLNFVTQALLLKEPWQFDPAVHEIPWRDAKESKVWSIAHGGQGGFSFGVVRKDHLVSPQPPVARAVQMVVDALEKHGHKTFPWDSPSLQEGLDTVFKTWVYDGGKDIHGDFAKSGERIAPQIEGFYGTEARAELTATEIAQNNLAHKKWKKEYMDAWNGTASTSGTGKPMDAIIAPLAPYAAARPGLFLWYGYSVFVNGLDYTAVSIPVTIANKDIDRYEDGYKPFSKKDQEVYDAYDPELYDGAHVSIQLIGRRLEEEKMLALAEYIGNLLGNKNE